MNNKLGNIYKKYPKGHFVGMWMVLGIAIFSGIGVPISIITNNFGFIGIGPAIGVSIGLAIGQSIENKYEKEGKIRSLTESEKQNGRNTITAGIVLLSLGVMMFLLFFYMD